MNWKPLWAQKKQNLAVDSSESLFARNSGMGVGRPQRTDLQTALERCSVLAELFLRHRWIQSLSLLYQ